MKCLLRFALAQGAVTYGLELMTALFRIAQGMVAAIMDSSGLAGMQAAALPEEMKAVVEEVGFLDSIPL